MSHHGKKHEEEESGESAPLWMITFSDMASLLMAFFVMLTTFASFGPEESQVIRGIRDVILKPNYGFFASSPKTSVIKPHMKTEAEQGSEKPTFEKEPGGGIAQRDLQDFRNKKVFLIQSQSAFLANSANLSPDGREFLKNFAMFVKEVPNRIIISESGGTEANVELGVARSMAVVKYLTQHGVSADYCNIGAQGISPAENFRNERLLEIALLDEGVSK
jgi:flagellar motor protein MotB